MFAIIWFAFLEFRTRCSNCSTSKAPMRSFLLRSTLLARPCAFEVVLPSSPYKSIAFVDYKINYAKALLLSI